MNKQMISAINNSTLEYFPPNCFSNNAVEILDKKNNIYMNEIMSLNDFEKFVSTGTHLYTDQTYTNDNKIYSKTECITNEGVSNKSPYDFKLQVQLPSSEIIFNDSSQLIDFPDKVGNKIWNSVPSENNSCSKSHINDNMGYNASSIESIVNNAKTKENQQFQLLKPDSDSLCLQSINHETCNGISNVNMKPEMKLKDINQIKVFKNGKSGHSRLWNSCGSAGSLQFNVDIKNFTGTTTDLKPLYHGKNSHELSTEYDGTDARNKSFCDANVNLKRISQASYEAEFDPGGRIHEQINIDIQKCDPYIIAGQITLIELSYFKKVKSEEFLSFKWTGQSKYIHAPAIVASTRWFNQLNFWAQRFVLEVKDLNLRSEMLSYIIRIVKKLVDNFNNISSGMALMSALQVECIHRLKGTWNNISSKDKSVFRRMEELYSSENNYERLRIHIDSLKLPCIPYLGLYLTDLTYINIAHKQSEFESQTKTDQINNILRKVSEFQQSSYEVSPNPLLVRYFDNQRYIEELQKIIEDTHYRTSISLEPPHPCDSTLSMSTTITTGTSIARKGVPLADNGCVEVVSSTPKKSTTSIGTIVQQQGTMLNGTAFNEVSIICGNLQSPISPQLLSVANVPALSNDLFISNNTSLPTVNHEAEGGHKENQSQEQFTEIGCNQLNSQRNISITTDINNSDAVNSEDFSKLNKICDQMINVNKDSNRSSVRKSFFRRKSSSKRASESNLSKRDKKSKSNEVETKKTNIPFLSLLDDSFLDVNLTDNQVASYGAGKPFNDRSSFKQPIDRGKLSLIASDEKELLCSPPICKCKIKDGSVNLKPKSSSNRKTEMVNLINIAHAADIAAKFSIKSFDSRIQSSTDCEQLMERFQNFSDSQESAKLICQGILLRKSCLKNSKKPLFSSWNRYWCVLIVSKTNSYLVYFENSNFRAIDRKDFKHKKCYVQDLNKISISLNWPSCIPFFKSSSTKVNKSTTSDRFSSSQQRLSPAQPYPPVYIPLPTTNTADCRIDNIIEPSNTKPSQLKRFYLIDEAYGTVYKFREAIFTHSKLKRSVASVSIGGNESEPPKLEPNCDIVSPTLSIWYQRLVQCINKTCGITFPEDHYNKDLIVLNDNGNG